MRVLIILIFYSFSLFAQTPEQNHDKYWYYRQRLNNDFIMLGEGQGKSLIVGQRAFGDSLSNKLKFGDETIKMGWHLGMLATEYALLKRHNQNTSTTVEELYYVLQAFNRLDETAESYFRCPTCPANPQPGDLNGFFIRDDVPANFLQSPDVYNHFNQHITSNKTVSTVNSDFTDPDPQIKEESNDQVWHLLIGLALITELVDESVSYNGLFIVDESRAIAHRIMEYIMKNDWIIINPVTGLKVKRGESARTLSAGANKAGVRIDTDNISMYLNDSLSNLPYYKNIWQSLQNISNCVYPPPSINPCKEYHKVLSLVAIGHSWQGTNGGKLNSLSAQQRYEHLPLINKILNPSDILTIADTTYERILNFAPARGPYNYGYPQNSSNFEWSSTNRFLYPERRGYNSSSGGGFFPGEYPGLDYMFVFNMYALVNENYLTNYGSGTVTGVNEELGKVTVGCYPNPFTSHTNVCLNTLPEEEITFVLFDILGKELRREKVSSATQKIERNDLSPGVYIYKIEAKNKTLSTGKLVVK